MPDPRAAYEEQRRRRVLEFILETAEQAKGRKHNFQHALNTIAREIREELRRA